MANITVDTGQSSANIIYVKEVILTDAQIKSLPTTAVEIVPAPGTGKMIVPISTIVVLNSLAGAYTNIADSSWILKNGDDYVSSPLQVDGLLGSPQIGYSIIPVPLTNQGAASFAGVTVVVWNSTTFENRPLTILDDWVGVPDYTGGNAANTLKIITAFTIIDI